LAALSLQLRKRGALIPATLAPGASAGVADIVPEQHPRDAALFGIAMDGLPIYLHLGDPRPGPILVVGHPAPLLRTIVHSAAQAGAITQVITLFPENWDDLRGQTVIVETDDRYLDGIAAEVFRKKSYPRWLVVLDRYNVQDFGALAHICRWGPPRGIWPIVAADAPAEVPDAIRPLVRTLVTANGNSYRLCKPKKPTLLSPGGWQTAHTFFTP
jgi:hypothetical protein